MRKNKAESGESLGEQGNSFLRKCLQDSEMTLSCATGKRSPHDSCNCAFFQPFPKPKPGTSDRLSDAGKRKKNPIITGLQEAWCKEESIGPQSAPTPLLPNPSSSPKRLALLNFTCRFQREMGNTKKKRGERKRKSC